MLFVCNQWKDRSKTAFELFGGDYCGIYSNEKPLTKELIDKAYYVVCMQEEHRDFIAEYFPKEYMQKKIIVIDVPNIYCYMQKELVELLKRKIKKNIWTYNNLLQLQAVLVV